MCARIVRQDVTRLPGVVETRQVVRARPRSPRRRTVRRPGAPRATRAPGAPRTDRAGRRRRTRSTRAPWWGTCLASPSASSWRTASRIGEMLMPSDRASSSSRSGVPGVQLAENDRLAQLLEGVLGHRPVADPAGVGRTRTRHLAQDRPTTLDQMSNAVRGSPHAADQPTRLRLPDHDVPARALPTTCAAYAAAGLDGIGIWELKLPAGGDAEALELLDGVRPRLGVRDSGAARRSCRCRSSAGPTDPAERVDALLRLARSGSRRSGRPASSA